MNPYPCRVPTIPPRWTRVAFLTLVALLPLHTVFFRAEIAIKPWLLLLVVVAGLDLLSQEPRWSKRALIGGLIFLLAVLASWPGPGAGTTFWRLFLALAAGVLLLLVVGRHGSPLDDLLKVVFWSGAGVAATAFVLALITNGALGQSVMEVVNDLPLVDRVNKPAYLGSGFVALTNWHQDPGYSALWTNVWLALGIVAWSRGAVKAPVWVPPLVFGGLGLASLLTFSRTGWGGLVIAVVAAIYVSWRGGAHSFRRGLIATIWGVVAGLALLGIQVLADPPGVGGDVATSLEFRLGYLFALGQIDVGEVGVTDPTLIVDDNRIDVWTEYWGRFAGEPWRGIGLGTGWGEVGLQEPHNLGVQLLAETGIVGLLGFLFLMLGLGRVVDPLPAAILLIVLLAGVAQTVLFEPVLWFALGLWLAGSGPYSGSVARDASVQGLATKGR